MKARLHDGRLLISPETDFEEQWLASKYPQGETFEAFLKTGLCSNDVMGIVIQPPKENKNGPI